MIFLYDVTNVNECCSYYKKKKKKKKKRNSANFYSEIQQFTIKNINALKNKSRKKIWLS